MNTDRFAKDPKATAFVWIALLATSSVLFSFAWACATPFAALASVAGTQMTRRDAVASVTLAWLGNQTIGYLILHYPRTPDSFGWGAAIGIAALSAALLATVVSRGQRFGALATTAVAFVGAFGLYEGTLFAATAILPSGHGAFAFPIVLRSLEINMIALAALLVLARGAMAIGLRDPQRATSMACDASSDGLANVQPRSFVLWLSFGFNAQ